MRPALKRLPWKHKNSKVLYYAVGFFRQLLPGKLFRAKRANRLSEVRGQVNDYLRYRVNYYNKLAGKIRLGPDSERLSEFSPKGKSKAYFFDAFEHTRYFEPGLRLSYEFGDITWVPEQPTIVKSRPLTPGNSNSVILKLNKIRHFTYASDRKAFRDKKDMLVSRNHCVQPQRIKFLEMYINHPRCNVGKINDNGEHTDLLKERLTIAEQLDYKFILCIEGYDVASNLKWVMSSNSLAVMLKPKYESWFMEGRLIPDHHYVLLKNDFSDLDERMDFYINNPEKAEEIIRNAHEHVEQFRDRKREGLISLLVLEKYFYLTGQKETDENLKILFSGEETGSI